MTTQDLLAIRASVLRLWTAFNPTKPAAPEWVNMIAAEVDNLQPALVAEAVTMVLNHDAVLTNAVFQIRDAAGRIRGRISNVDPLDALGEDGRRGWREKNPALPGSPLDRLPAIPPKPAPVKPRRTR